MTFDPNWPRMVHKHGGQWIIVQDKAECDQKLAEGWHMQPPHTPPPVVQDVPPVAASEPHATKKTKRAKKAKG